MADHGECNRCNGTGEFTHPSGKTSECRKCGGTGKYYYKKESLLAFAVKTAARSYIKAKIG